MNKSRERWVELESAIEKRGETQTSLSKKIKERYKNLSLEPSDISALINGYRKCNLEKLKAFCEILAVSADYLLGFRKAEDTVEGMLSLEERLNKKSKDGNQYSEDVDRFVQFFDLLFACEEAEDSKNSFHLIDDICFYVFHKEIKQKIVFGDDGSLHGYINKEPLFVGDQEIMECSGEEFLENRCFRRITNALKKFRKYVQSQGIERNP